MEKIYEAPEAIVVEFEEKDLLLLSGEMEQGTLEQIEYNF